MKARPKIEHTTLDRILEAVKANPYRSHAQLASVVGVSRQRVHQVLTQLGYRKAWVKA